MSEFKIGDWVYAPNTYRNGEYTYQGKIISISNGIAFVDVYNTMQIMCLPFDIYTLRPAEYFDRTGKHWSIGVEEELDE